MATDAAPIDYTPLSSTKQNRIMIWRDEVASLALPEPSSDSSSLAPSSSNASASTGNSSSSSMAAANDDLANLSRRSRLWRRLSKRLRAVSLSSAPSPLDLELKAREEVRTGMYRESWAAEEAARKAAQQQDEETGDPILGILGARQERLERAQRLLNQGPVPPA